MLKRKIFKIMIDVSIEQACAITEQDNNDFQFLDARSSIAYNSGHIPGAVHVDCFSSEIYSKLNSLNKDAYYILYCNVNTRSKILAKIMEFKGFKNIYVISGGFRSWETMGYKISKPEPIGA